MPPCSGLWMESIRNPEILIDRFVEGRIVVCTGRRYSQPRVRAVETLPSRRSRHRLHGDGRPRASDVVGVITKIAVIADVAIHNFEE